MALIGVRNIIILIVTVLKQGMMSTVGTGIIYMNYYIEGLIISIM